MTPSEIKTQIERVQTEREFLATQWRFYGVLLSALPDVYDAPASITTAATDGRRIYWNLGYVKTLSRENLTFVTAHEILHVSLMHHFRALGWDLRLVNRAGDFVINLKLVADKIGKMPKGCLYDTRYIGWSMEDVIADLQQQEKQQQGDQPQDGEQGDGPEAQPGADGQDEGSEKPQEQGEGAGEGDDTPDGETATSEAPEGSEGQGEETQGSQDGTGSEEAPDPGHCGGVLPAPGDEAEQAEDKRGLEKAIRTAVAAAAKQAGGKVDGFGQMVLDGLDKAQVRWEDELEEFVSQSVITDYSWHRPDRRFNGGEWMLPGQVPDGCAHGVLFLDTSASMDDAMVKRCLEEVQGISDSGKVDKITVVCIDTQVRSVEDFEHGDTIKMDAYGRGGTRFQPAWEWLEQQDELPDFAVYLTDLEPFDGYGEAPDLPLLWACSTYSVAARPGLRKRMAEVPFGRCIEVQ